MAQGPSSLVGSDLTSFDQANIAIAGTALSTAGKGYALFGPEGLSPVEPPRLNAPIHASLCDGSEPASSETKVVLRHGLLGQEEERIAPHILGKMDLLAGDGPVVAAFEDHPRKCIGFRSRWIGKQHEECRKDRQADRR